MFFKKIVTFTLLLSIVIVTQAKTLTLIEVEREAAKNSFEVQSKKFEEKKISWEKKNTTASYFPKVDFNTTYLMMGADFVNDNNSSPFAPGLYEHSFSHELKISQPISNGGAEIFAIKLADHVEKLFKHEKQDVIEVSVTNARKSYFDLISIREMKKISLKNIEWTKKNLEIAKLKVEAGGSILTDQLRWETELIAAKNSLAKVKANEKALVYRLYHSMGVKIEDADEKIELISLREVERLFNNSAIDEKATINNSTVALTLDESILIAKGYKDLALSSFLPKVNSFYSYSWPGWDKVSFNSDASYWRAGISISIPIFGGGENYTSYKMAEFEEYKANSEAKAAKNSLNIARESIKLNYNASKEAATASRKQVELASKQLQMLQERYDMGGIGQSALLEIALAEQNAKLGYISALLETLKLETDYRKIIGNMGVK